MSDYKCKKCGAKFEKAESCGCSCSTEEVKCPQCASTDLEKVDGLSKIGDFLKKFQFSGG